jgi:integrase
MLLADYCCRYLAERPGLSRDYHLLLTATVRQLYAHAGRPLSLEESDRPLLAAWAESLLQTHGPITINNKLRMVRSLLLAAYDDDLLDRPPRRIRRLPEDLPPPEAWTVDEVRRLLAHLDCEGGRVGQSPASDWWTSLVLVVYWTACRIGALLRVEVSDYQPGVGLTVKRQKNGHQQWYALPPACCERLERVLPDSGRIWHWPYHKRTLWSQFRRHIEAAGLPCPRTGRSLFHRLRRTNASYCAAEDPAIAQRQLDHADYAVTLRSYVDPRIASRRSAIDVLPDPTPAPSRRPPLRVVG